MSSSARAGRQPPLPEPCEPRHALIRSRWPSPLPEQFELAGEGRHSMNSQLLRVRACAISSCVVILLSACGGGGRKKPPPVVDTTAPDTTISAAPAALSNSNSASFTFTSSGNRLDFRKPDRRRRVRGRDEPPGPHECRRRFAYFRSSRARRGGQHGHHTRVTHVGRGHDATDYGNHCYAGRHHE